MEIKARVPGMIVDVKVNVGDTVEVKDLLLVMEAMKMEQPIPTPVSGEVTEVLVEKGSRVRSGDVLVVVE